MTYATIAELKAAVTAAIYANNSGLITAEDLQELLHDLIDTLNVLGGNGGGSGGGTGVTDGTLIFEKDGDVFRQTIRNGEFCLDQAITETGFDGDEGVDWANIKRDSL